METLTINGNIYRVECNFNAIIDYMEQKGEKDLSFLANGDMSMRDWLLLMRCSINEGERLEGRPHEHTAEEFGAISMIEMGPILQRFIDIFGKQNKTSADTQKKE